MHLRSVDPVVIQTSIHIKGESRLVNFFKKIINCKRDIAFEILKNLIINDNNWFSITYWWDGGAILI